MKNSDKKIWKKWWFWFIVVFIIMISPFIRTGENNINSNRTHNEIQTTNTSINEEVNENKYAEDDLINEFIRNFKSTSSYELTDIEKGNIRTKYFAHINEQYCEFLNSTESLANCFNITIYGGNEEEDINKIISVYKELIKTLDSTISETYINDAIMECIKHPSNNYKINDSINIKLYPIVELSYGKSNCRIEIATTIYNKK